MCLVQQLARVRNSHLIISLWCILFHSTPSGRYWARRRPVSSACFGLRVISLGRIQIYLLSVWHIARQDLRLRQMCQTWCLPSSVRTMLASSLPPSTYCPCRTCHHRQAVILPPGKLCVQRQTGVCDFGRAHQDEMARNVAFITSLSAIPVVVPSSSRREAE